MPVFIPDTELEVLLINSIIQAFTIELAGKRVGKSVEIPDDMKSRP